MVTKKNKKLTEELLKVQIDAVDSIYIQDEFSNMQVAIGDIIEQLSLSNFDDQKLEIIDQLIQVCNNVLDQIIMNINIQVTEI